MKKKGQVTVFFIIGLVILIIIAGYFGVQYAISKGWLLAAVEKRIEVPQQILPVSNFLDTCVIEITQEATDLVGFQGGFYELPTDPMPTTPFTPFSANLEILEGSGLAVPFWFRERGNNIQVLNTPSRKEVQNALADYISDNFHRCVENLTIFVDQGFEITTINPQVSAEVSFTDKEIISKVTYPLDVKLKDISFSLREHSAKIQSPFGELYNVAKEILTKENQGFYFENKTLDMMIAYPAIPMTGTDLSCSKSIWSKNKVIQDLRNALFDNIATFRVKGTNYRLNDDRFKYMEFDMLDKPHKDININFLYSPSWPTLIDITPSKGDIMESSSITQEAGSLANYATQFFCINNYRFVYDLKYPLLVTLTGPDNTIFQFATEVIIDNNFPRFNRRVPIEAIPETESPICQFPTKNLAVTTYTINAFGDFVELPGVSLSLKCTPSLCDLGTTQEGATAFLKVPPCYNAILQGEKQGYHIGKLKISTNTPETEQLFLILEPYYEKPVNIFVIEKETGEIREPFESETIYFEFVNEEEAYSEFFNHPAQNKIKLVPGNYKISSFIYGESTWPITTQKQEVQNCIDVTGTGLLGIFTTSEQCFTSEIPSMEFEFALKGGAQFEHEFTNFDLALDSPLNLYILSEPIPSDLEGFTEIQQKIDLNKDHPNFRYPDIS